MRSNRRRSRRKSLILNKVHGILEFVFNVFRLALHIPIILICKLLNKVTVKSKLFLAAIFILIFAFLLYSVSLNKADHSPKSSFVSIVSSTATPTPVKLLVSGSNTEPSNFNFGSVLSITIDEFTERFNTFLSYLIDDPTRSNKSAYLTPENILVSTASVEEETGLDENMITYQLSLPSDDKYAILITFFTDSSSDKIVTIGGTISQNASEDLTTVYNCMMEILSYISISNNSSPSKNILSVGGQIYKIVFGVGTDGCLYNGVAFFQTPMDNNNAMRYNISPISKEAVDRLGLNFTVPNNIYEEP